MDFVILDLEWNASYSRKRKAFLNEIIEIGAVKCDENLNPIGEFSCFVKPQVSKKISSTITNLTSITNDNLRGAVTFMQAASRLKKWVNDAVVFSWGTSDILTLIHNYEYFNASGEIPFLKKYCDLQMYAESMLGLDTSKQLGLSKAAELVEIDIESMDLHRALDDSKLSFEIFKRVYNKKEIGSYIQECNEDFYKRMTFKTSYITDLKNSDVDKKMLKFACPKCGERASRQSKWMQKNKGFVADFKCFSCGYKFTGRVILKQKFEGITVNKKTFGIAKIEKPRDISAENCPQAINNMKLTMSGNGVALLKFKELERINGIRHAFSTRIGGISQNEFASMNLGFGRGDDEENVAQNYKLICEALGVEIKSLITGAQDHHINIRKVTSENAGTGIWREKDMESIDGLCTNVPGLTLVIYCADCVPLYFVDKKSGAIGLAHAGWKGTAAGMAKAMVEKLNAEYGTRPENLTMTIGPSICKSCFEVDEPVANVFNKLENSGEFVEDTGDGKYHIDLWECNRLYAIGAGVLPENIHVGGVCTMCNSDLLFSHRVTKGHRGSNAAFLSIER